MREREEKGGGGLKLDLDAKAFGMKNENDWS